jgi:hypothetical protein
MTDKEAERKVLDALVDPMSAPAWVMVLPTRMTEQGHPGRIVVTKDGTGTPEVNGTYMVFVKKVSSAAAVEMLKGNEDGGNG